MINMSAIEYEIRDIRVDGDDALVIMTRLDKDNNSIDGFGFKITTAELDAMDVTALDTLLQKEIDDRILELAEAESKKSVDSLKKQDYESYKGRKIKEST